MKKIIDIQDLKYCYTFKRKKQSIDTNPKMTMRVNLVDKNLIQYYKCTQRIKQK